MQYPIPPWESRDRFGERRTHVGPDNPRYRHLPLVTGTADGALVVLRGEESAVLAGIAASPSGDVEQQRNRDLVFREDKLGEPFFVVTNRLGRVRFVSATGLTVVGQIEHYLYSEPYDVSPSLTRPQSLADLRVALNGELARVEVLAEAGWELVDPYTDGGPPLLVDTRRPDEALRKQDLP